MAERREQELTLDDVLRSAARLQELVPDAVLVGGSAAAFHAGHRLSLDHDHVVADLADRFDSVLANLEAIGEWSTARVQEGKIILGNLGGIESGIRQLKRTRPLEIEIVRIDGRDLRVPSAAEMLRIKAWLILHRNQVRDYLDVVALADHLGQEVAASVLVELGDYYSDIYSGEIGVVTQLVRQLADPRPRDTRTTKHLDSYRQLDERWHEWSAVVEACADLAAEVTLSWAD